MPRRMPRQKPGKSETVVATPWEFVNAVKSLVGIKHFDIDLAADATNSKGLGFLSKKDDSLSLDWDQLLEGGAWGWLNPPYDDIEPWVRKAAHANSHIAVLVPASVGSVWWHNFVHEECFILFPRPRITFVGHKYPYPKDLALLLYGSGETGYDTWKWR